MVDVNSGESSAGFGNVVLAEPVLLVHPERKINAIRGIILRQRINNIITCYPA